MEEVPSPFTQGGAEQNLPSTVRNFGVCTSRGQTYVCAQGPPAKGLSAAGHLSSTGEANVFTLFLSYSTLHEIIQYELDH